MHNFSFLSSYQGLSYKTMKGSGIARYEVRSAAKTRASLNYGVTFNPRPAQYGCLVEWCQNGPDSLHPPSWINAECYGGPSFKTFPELLTAHLVSEG